MKGLGIIILDYMPERLDPDVVITDSFTVYTEVGSLGRSYVGSDWVSVKTLQDWVVLTV